MLAPPDIYVSPRHPRVESGRQSAPEEYIQCAVENYRYHIG